MERLRQNDINGLRRFAEAVSQPCDLEELGSRVLPALTELIPGDVSVFSTTNLAQQKLRWELWPAIQTPPVEVFQQYQDQHPVLSYMAVKGDPGAVAYSDFVSQRQFHDLALYQEFFKYAYTEDGLGFFMVRANNFSCFSVNRSIPGFSDRERLLLQLATSHIHQASRNAEVLGLIDHAMSNGVSAVVLLDADLHLLHASRLALTLLERYFPSQPLVLGLPAILVSWLRSVSEANRTEDVPAVQRPLVGETDAGMLRIQVHISAPPGDQVMLMLYEEKRPNLGLLADEYGLTRREIEVLILASEGRSNAQIAEALTLSRRTVDRHFENIYNKLGVNSRGGALALVYAERG